MKRVATAFLLSLLVSVLAVLLYLEDERQRAIEAALSAAGDRLARSENRIEGVGSTQELILEELRGASARSEAAAERLGRIESRLGATAATVSAEGDGSRAVTVAELERVVDSVNELVDAVDAVSARVDAAAAARPAGLATFGGGTIVAGSSEAPVRLWSFSESVNTISAESLSIGGGEVQLEVLSFGQDAAGPLRLSLQKTAVDLTETDSTEVQVHE